MDLDKALGAALFVAVVAGVLAVAVALLCCAICGNLACCARLVGRPAAPIGATGGSAADPRSRGFLRRRGDPNLFALLVAGEVRR